MRLWLSVLTMLFMGCASPHRMASQQEAFHYYPLLLPSSYGGTVAIEQFLDGWAKGEHFQLHSQLEIDAHQILVLGFTAFQTRAFTLRYDGTAVTFENFTDRRMPFPPVMILSDIQKVLWPALPNQDGWSIVDDAIARVRLVFFEGQVVTRIQYEGASPLDGDVELVDLLYGYQFRIRTLNVWGG
jgi:Protein of unknown function (DUF3261)